MNFFSVTDVQSLPKNLPPLSLVIGNFDGIHQGHQQLLKVSTEWAKAHHGISVALTFHPHPLAVLAPRPGYARLFSLQDRQEQLQKRGVSGVVVQPFSLEFAQIPAAEFLSQYLHAYFHPQQVVVGHDFGFGQGRRGNVQLLREFCDQHHIELQAVPPFKISDEVVSSSAVRQALREGNVEKASLFLGRPFSLRGPVVSGDKRGHTIGFPTANLNITAEQIPRLGVYATKTHYHGKVYASVTNVGIHPTFQSQENPPVKVETHIMNFSEDIYGKEIQVDFNHYLRSEKKFSGIDELTQQIKKDIQAAKDKS